MREVRADIGSYFRSLRGQLDGDRFPYAWVPEWHASGHGLHVHFAVGQFIRRGLIEGSWGHGFVHIKLIGDLPVGSGPLQEARVAAGYLSKYVAKSFEENPQLGLHRYDLGQGFQPEKRQFAARSADLVIEEASSVMGKSPSLRWSSREVEGWGGPPAIWVQWA